MPSGQPLPLSDPRRFAAVSRLPLPLWLFLLILVFASPAHAELAALRDESLQISPQLALPLGDAAEPVLEQQIAPAPLREMPDDLRPATIDLTATPDDLWQRIRHGFGMPDLESPLVADRQAWYLNRPELLQRVLMRSRKYLYHIVEELEKRGMPTELALLPVVESSFNPLAYSRARAMGIWQFIPATGKSYNLTQNWWLDERRDIIASTSAALDYLQNIYEMHGDWHLALASYNWGENAVARAIAKNRAKGLRTDYPHLTMPGETRYYVPKLQAIKNIIAQPELFGFSLDPIPNQAYFDTVNMDVDVDVVTAAKLAETPLAEFVALNPAYQRPLIPGTSKNPLVIPADKMDAFQANLARYEAQDKPLSNWRTYRLKNREKLETVAARFGIATAKLRQLNGIGPRSKIGAGQNLIVPVLGAATSPDQLAALLPKTPEPPRKAKGSKRNTKAKGKPVRKTRLAAKTATRVKGKKRR